MKITATTILTSPCTERGETLSSPLEYGWRLHNLFSALRANNDGHMFTFPWLTVGNPFRREDLAGWPEHPCATEFQVYYEWKQRWSKQ